MPTEKQVSIKDVIGADVSKDKIDFYFSNENRYEVVENTEATLKKFIKKMDKKMIGIVVMEYTGGYEEIARKLLTASDIPTHVAHPAKIHYFAKQKGYFAKTDKLDAKIIAQFGTQESVSSSPIPSKIEIELKELSSRRGQLVSMLLSEKNRVKVHLSLQAKRSLNRNIKNLEREISLVENQIKKRIENDEEKRIASERLQTFKGVGETIANGLLAGLKELGSLNRTGIAALLGVAPKNRDSGRKTGKRTILGGRFDVRKLVYMAALSAIRHNLVMKDFYNKLKEKGKPSKVAIVAVMRKIIITLNAMLRDGVDYDEQFLQ